MISNRDTKVSNEQNDKYVLSMKRRDLLWKKKFYQERKMEWLYC